MDERVRRAMARWPKVPALYGWLRLDETGRWWLDGAIVRNQALFDYIGRNYTCNKAGEWYFQNGPQRGFVALDHAPWVLHLDSAGTLRNHIGETVALTGAAVLDDEGNLLLETARGLGLLAGESLAIVAQGLTHADGRPAGIEAIEAAIGSGDPGGLQLAIAGCRMPLRFIPRGAIPKRFGFVRDPQPPG